MRFISFAKDGTGRVGVQDGDTVVDLSVADPALPASLLELIVAGPGAMEQAAKAAQSAPDGARLSLDGLDYLPLIPNPGKIICIGRNYAAHAAEGGASVPDYPEVFYRGASSMIGHEKPIIRPKCSHNLDYEGELVAVIGSRTRHATEDNALASVAGYSLFHDASLRDYQRKSSQWTVGKNFDATGPFGPALVTPDELPDGADGLRIQTRLNGKIMQDANTSDMVYYTARLIAILSECMTLYPGDIIVTGTPAGVGYARTPPVWMKPGDVCEIEIDGIGILRNSVEDEVLP